MIKEFYYWTVFYIRKLENDSPELSSYLLTSIMVSSNIVTIFMIIRYLFDFSISINNNDTTYIGLGLAFCVGLFCYFYTYKRREAIQIKYDALTKKRKQRGQIIFWCFIVLSISLFFTLGAALIR